MEFWLNWLNFNPTKVSIRLRIDKIKTFYSDLSSPSFSYVCGNIFKISKFQFHKVTNSNWRFLNVFLLKFSTATPPIRSQLLLGSTFHSPFSTNRPGSNRTEPSSSDCGLDFMIEFISLGVISRRIWISTFLRSRASNRPQSIGQSKLSRQIDALVSMCFFPHSLFSSSSRFFKKKLLWSLSEVQTICTNQGRSGYDAMCVSHADRAMKREFWKSLYYSNQSEIEIPQAQTSSDNSSLSHYSIHSGHVDYSYRTVSLMSSFNLPANPYKRYITARPTNLRQNGEHQTWHRQVARRNHWLRSEVRKQRQADAIMCKSTLPLAVGGFPSEFCPTLLPRNANDFGLRKYGRHIGTVCTLAFYSALTIKTAISLMVSLRRAGWIKPGCSPAFSSGKIFHPSANFPSH